MSTPVKNPSGNVPEDAKHWKYEEVGDTPPVPLEEAWGSGKEPIHGKQLRGRAVHVDPTTGRAEPAPGTNPSQRGDSEVTGDEGQDQGGRPNINPEEDPPDLGEGEGSLSDQDKENPNTGATDNVDPKPEESDEDDDDDESEGEVKNSLLATSEPAQTKVDVEINTDDIEGEGDIEAPEEGDTKAPEESDIKAPEEGDGVVEANNGSPIGNKRKKTSEDEDDGEWTPVRRRTGASLIGPSTSTAIPSNERYFLKDFFPEDTDGEENDLFVSSLRLPAARNVQYDQTRGLDSTALEHGNMERSGLLFERQQQSVSALSTNISGRAVPRDTIPNLPPTIFSRLGSGAPPESLSTALSSISGTNPAAPSVFGSGRSFTFTGPRKMPMLPQPPARPPHWGQTPTYPVGTW